MARWMWLLAVSGPVWSQCYDLTSTHLYQPYGHFQEWWDKPLWSAKPGEGNFTVDHTGPGEFSVSLNLFAAGEVRKTEKGWVPLHKSRNLTEIWCEETPQRSTGRCYMLPYSTPPPGARRLAPMELNRETWSLSADGQLRYAHRTRGEGDAHTFEDGRGFDAVLDLNTGAYSMTNHGHATGMYKRRIPAGVEMLRIESGSAKAKLKPIPCSAKLQKASLREDGSVSEEVMNPVPLCVVRMKAKTGGSPAEFEFVQNPLGASSPQGCVVIHDEPFPQDDLRLAAGKTSVTEVPVK